MLRAEEILDTPLPGRDADSFIRMFSAVKDAAVSVMNLGLKADENRLRKRKNDVLEELYAKIALERGDMVIENI